MSDMIIGGALPNIPWEDRPEGCTDVVWRSAKNPIITRDAIKNSNSVFNSAVVPYKGEFRGVFRSDDTCRLQKLYSGRSKDGIHWEISQKPIKFICDNEEISEFVFGYDPRVCFIEDRYYVTWCNGYHGVMETCQGLNYSMGAAILDIDKPWKVKYRAKPYLLSPRTEYECMGDVPNVVFPVAALCDAPTGRIAIYYGAADTVVAMAFTQADEVVEFIKTHVTTQV